jgi:hypothetical protein
MTISPGHDERSRKEAPTRQWLTQDRDTDNKGADSADVHTL